MLHITKVAFGCTAIDDLREWIAGTARESQVFITTRNRPTRHAEMAEGSLFWILKHQLIARQRLLGFFESEDSARWQIRLAAELIPVRPVPKRAHQGWRYLSAVDAPLDLSTMDDAMPESIRAELAALGLL